ncbi:hypothetical protein SLA2020_153390 [Shorea laevis]
MQSHQNPVAAILHMENQFASFPLIFAFLVFLAVVLKIWKKCNSKSSTSKPPPVPGPPKLPFIGNLHLLTSNLPYLCLRNLANKYGPVMHLQLGEISTFVVSSLETAKEVTKTHDLILANRPSIHAAKLVTYNFSDLVLAPYGEHWRQLRKICTVELLSAKRVQTFRSIREEEVSNLIKSISSKAGSVVNLRKLLRSLALSITARAAFGEKCKQQEEFKQIVPDIVSLFTGLSLIDVFPSIKLFHLIHAMRPKHKRLHQKVDEILENIIKEHRANLVTGGTGEVETTNLVDVLLNLQDHGALEIPLTTDSIKGFIMNVFTAGSEPFSLVVEWALSEMMKNPKVLEKAQAEVRHVFSSKGYVGAAGLPELKYLNLVIKESMRLHMPAPLLLPRESRERCEIKGYEIPAKSRVIVNVWAIARDPKYWTEADKFNPERFSDGAIDYKGTNFEFLPFGGGRRLCPGISFGTAIIELALANLLYYFDWKLPEGKKPEDLDMTEIFKAALTRKYDLCVIPIPYYPKSSM